MEAAADDEAAIAALIAQGDEAGAFGRLRARLGWPRGRELADGELPRYLTLLGDLAERRGRPRSASWRSRRARISIRPIASTTSATR